MKAAVIKVCDENQIDNLLRSQWESLKEIRSLLENFAKHTLQLQANNATTVSLVVPAIIDLGNEMQRVSEHHSNEYIISTDDILKYEMF